MAHKKGVGSSRTDASQLLSDLASRFSAVRRLLQETLSFVSVVQSTMLATTLQWVRMILFTHLLTEQFSSTRASATGV